MIFKAHVGKYTSTVEHLGYVITQKKTWWYSHVYPTSHPSPPQTPPRPPTTVLLILFTTRLRCARNVEKSWQLAGGWYTYPYEKYEFVSWDDCPQYMKNISVMDYYWDDCIVYHWDYYFSPVYGKNKQCSKPPIKQHVNGQGKHCRTGSFILAMIGCS